MKNLYDSRTKQEAEILPLDTEERKIFNYLVNSLHKSVGLAYDYIKEYRKENRHVTAY